MNTKKQSIHQIIASKYGLPTQVIEVICNSPFKFAKEIIVDDNDGKDIMLAYLGKIKLKTKYLCKNILKNA